MKYNILTETAFFRAAQNGSLDDMTACYGEFIPNRSLGPISSGDVKVFSCSPESKECLPLIHGSHET